MSEHAATDWMREIVVGYDGGDGEIAAAITTAADKDAPVVAPIAGVKSQVAAIARTIAGRTLIGEEVFWTDEPVAERHITFKDDPAVDAGAGQLMAELAAGVRSALRSSGAIPSDEVRWLVGYPPGWSAPAPACYRSLLAAAGLENVEVVPEPRAAIYAAWEAGPLKGRHIDAPLIAVVDAGSSTFDVTIVAFDDNRPVRDYGYPIGAGALDRGLFARSLAMAKHRDAIDAALSRRPEDRATCEFYCRRAKELYFTNPQATKISVGVVELDGGVLFKPIVNDEVMAEVLAMPLVPLGDRDLSYPEAVREALTELRADLVAGSLAPATVLMTGGASRMPFLPRLVEETLGVEVIIDLEPEFVVARGLSRVGRAQARLRAFDREIAILAETTIPSLIEAEMPALIDRLAQAIADGLLRDVVRPALRDWVEERIPSLEAVDGVCQSRTRSWLESASTRRRIATETAAWFLPIQQELDRKGARITARFDLEEGVLGFAPEYRPGSVDVGELSAQVDVDGMSTVIGVTVAGTTTVLLLGSGVLVMLGPLGWIILAAGGLAGWLIGKDELDRRLRAGTLPAAMRRMILSSDQIEHWGTVADGDRRQAMIERVRAALTTDSQARTQLIDSIVGQLQSGLERRAATARRLIR